MSRNKLCIFSISLEEISTLKSDDQTIFCNGKYLPIYIALDKKKLGYMRLRTHGPSVLRIHESKNKPGHEVYYCEIQLFSHWRNELDEIPTGANECAKVFELRRLEIDKNRQTIYPGTATIEILDKADFESIHPTHIGDTLDAQGEQENNDDLEEGCIDDPAFESHGYTGNLDLEKPHPKQFDSYRFKKIVLPGDVELKHITRMLVPEQMNILREVISCCKAIIKARNNHAVELKQLLLIIHGGAGEISFCIFFQFHR